MSLTAEDVNYIVYRYLQESGFIHSAYIFRNESNISWKDMDHHEYEVGCLIKLIQRGLQYMELEANAEDGGKFEVLTAGDILRAKNTAQLKTLVRDRREEEDDCSRDLSPLLAEPCKQHGATLDHGTADVFDAHWSPSGDRLATNAGGCAPGSEWFAGVWDVGESCSAATQPVITKLEHDFAVIHSISAAPMWSPDGLQVATGTNNGYVCLWEANGVLRKYHKGHAGPVGSVEFSPDASKLLSSSEDKTAVLWDTRSGNITQTIATHSEVVVAAKWCDDAMFATASTDREIHVFSLDGCEPATQLRALKGHDDHIRYLDWAPNKWLLASCAGWHVKLWGVHQTTSLCDLIDDELPSTPNAKPHADCIHSCRFRPAGPGSRNPNLSVQLATTSDDTTVKLWDCENGSLLQALAHSVSVNTCDWSPDGQILAAGSLVDGHVLLWNAHHGRLIRKYVADDGVFGVEWNKDGRRLAISRRGGGAYVVDTRV